MKICLIASPTSIHTLRWIEFLKKAGNEVHLITFSPAEVNGATVHSLNAKFSLGLLSKIFAPLPTLLDLRFIPKIKRILKEIKPDILHGHYLTCYAFFAACTTFHPLVVSAWGSDLSTDPDQSVFSKLIIKYVFKKADLIHLADKPAKDRAIKLGCEDRKIFLQLWGIDVSRFSPENRSEILRRQLGIESSYAIINANALTNQKYCHDVLIKAIPHVLKNIENVKFIFTASGPSKQELKQLAEKLNIKNHVIFLGGISYAKMPTYLASADIYVDTFYPRNMQGGSGVGIAIMEAMASGLPQIMPQTPTIIDPNNNWFRGISYRPGDYKDLAKKITYLLQNQSLRENIARESRIKAVQVFDLNKNINNWQQIYEHLVKIRNK